MRLRLPSLTAALMLVLAGLTGLSLRPGAARAQADTPASCVVHDPGYYTSDSCSLGTARTDYSGLTFTHDDTGPYKYCTQSNEQDGCIQQISIYAAAYTQASQQGLSCDFNPAPDQYFHGSYTLTYPQTTDPHDTGAVQAEGGFTCQTTDVETQSVYISLSACTLGSTCPPGVNPEAQTLLEIDYSPAAGQGPAGAIVVNDAGDDALPSGATSCDVDPNTTGDQCTLRAAISYANTRSTTQAITFDIPGTATPTISPATALPVATTEVRIDGTTQPGGWVIVSGAAQASGNGLEVDGESSTVRGLVVNGFSAGAGLVAGGSSGNQVFAGDRVGTDVTGTTAIPNEYGILLSAPDVTVGGTAGTSGHACTGDCDLVSGNSVDEITNYVSVSGLAGPAYVAATIQGDWIGVDATGEQALGKSNGVVMEWGNVTSFSAGQQILIGGATSRPGLAPGNLIAAATAVGVAVQPIQSGITEQLAGNASIAGNLLGEDATGSRALASGTDGVDADGESLATADSVTVGGVGTGQGNVIGGWQEGVHIRSAAVIGDRIGTDLTGMHAVLNDIGVFFSSDGEARDDLISGNGTGVGGHVIVLTYGNVVGLAADEVTPLPNDTGVGLTAPGGIVNIGESSDGTPACSTLPCNVISGNRVAGISIPSSDTPGVNVGGTYLGTDVSGTRAVPNGIGINLSPLCQPGMRQSSAGNY